MHADDTASQSCARVLKRLMLHRQVQKIGKCLASAPRAKAQGLAHQESILLEELSVGRGERWAAVACTAAGRELDQRQQHADSGRRRRLRHPAGARTGAPSGARCFKNSRLTRPTLYSRSCACDCSAAGARLPVALPPRQLAQPATRPAGCTEGSLSRGRAHRCEHASASSHISASAACTLLAVLATLHHARGGPWGGLEQASAAVPTRPYRTRRRRVPPGTYSRSYLRTLLAIRVQRCTHRYLRV